MEYTVKQIAKIAGISVRTLHFYDEIGLLKPSYIKENGYRFYGKKELLKLQQVLFFKELDFSLEEITKMLSDPSFNTQAALIEQRSLLELRKERLKGLVETIDKTIKSMKGGDSVMTNDDLFASFSMEQIEEYKDEAKRRWGNTDAYKQSMERTNHWSKEDYRRATEEGKKFTQLLADTMDKGFDSPEFQELVAKHHESINVFYDCSHEMLRSLADMYISDTRFRATYDNVRPGLAEFMKNAIYYYCDQHEQKKN